MGFPPPQSREEWVPKAEERKNSRSGGRRGGAVQEGAEMVRGVSPWGRPRSEDAAQAMCTGEFLGGGPLAAGGTLCGQGLAQG